MTWCPIHPASSRPGSRLRSDWPRAGTRARLLIGYAIWAAVGVALIALISWVFFKESLTWVQVIGIVFVIAGVGLLELGGKH
jgi:small multidrug resistance pump